MDLCIDGLAVPNLSYPFFFRCTACHQELEITRAAASYLHVSPDSFEALNVVLDVRGWENPELGPLLCPKCREPSDGSGD